MNISVVDVNDVSKTYNHGRVQALRNVSLNVEQAAFIALAGPSGSGKTTLLNLIGALDIPDEGSIRVAGQSLSELNDKQRTALRRERIGFVFQQFNLVPVLTAAENVALPLEILPHISATERRQRYMEILKRVGLEGMEHRLPTQLSGGQQQRIAVARALVKNPPLVLADEPTANLDGTTGMAIVDLMNQMREELGVSFVFASHDPRLLERVDTVIEMVDGCVQP
ncbi:lipoprotein-releasing system ATP-binding protein LolD [bacterium BMS3Bbin04]|nr:lipoprotein-releasing system ATP-binding protein LolD [bacterium BMS3Bbin04]